MTDRLDEIKKAHDARCKNPQIVWWTNGPPSACPPSTMHEHIAYLLKEVERLHGLIAEKTDDIATRLEERLEARIDADIRRWKGDFS